MRPAALNLVFIVLASAAFTALTAFGVLGVIWLVLGPGVAAAAEIAASFDYGSGSTSSESRRGDPPAPQVGR
jgi:hypothetical protein